MHIKNFLEAIEYEITGSEKFTWDCYGPDARYFDFEIDLNTSISAIFSIKTQQVFEVQVVNAFWKKAFSWQDPQYVEQYIAECNRRNVAPFQAFDDVQYSLVTDEEEILKTVAQYRKYAKLGLSEEYSSSAEQER